METCLKLFRKLIAAHEYFPEHVQCRRNNLEIISAAEITLFTFRRGYVRNKKRWENFQVISVFYFACNLGLRLRPSIQRRFTGVRVATSWTVMQNTATEDDTLLITSTSSQRDRKIKSNVGRILSLVRGNWDNGEKWWLLPLISTARRYGNWRVEENADRKRMAYRRCLTPTDVSTA